MQAEILTRLCEELSAEGLPFTRQEPLCDHTTFRIGGPAMVFCEPTTVTELTRTLELCKQQGVRWYLLGNGSNTLFSDKGFDGVVVSLCKLQTRMTFEAIPDGEAVVCCGAGMLLGQLCREAEKRSLSGLEFAYGIPGTVGGAVYMNAGAYGGEMKDVLTEVSFLDEELHLRTLPVDQLKLGYRTSIFEEMPWCVVEVKLHLVPAEQQAIRAKMDDLMQRRRDKQPLEYPSAGSTFKRPEGAFAGKLIEDCGLRGFAVGGAQISEKHCGFVVNRGGATCADVVELTRQVRQIVEEKTGFVLEREIRVVE